MTTLPNTHALIVGIANYQQIRPLPVNVIHDARAIYDVLIDPTCCAYQPEQVTLLLNEQATLAALRNSLAELATKTHNESTVFLYLSCHGGQLQEGVGAGEYLLPVDTRYDSAEALTASALSGSEFTQLLRAIPARKVVVVLDCCHAGGIGQPKEAATPLLKEGLPESYYDQLKSGSGRVILASSRSSEKSWILPGDHNSLFTKHLLAGLRGGIPSADGLIRIFDLFEYLQPRVTGDYANQHPLFKAEIEENFPIALYLGGQKGAAPTTTPDFRYDAYISYVDQGADSEWVWATLVPKLEAAGLQVAVSGDVEDPGVARVVNVERGIKQAKRTVIVLSPAYLADHMADFENVLAQTVGLQEGEYRLLPVKIAEIDEKRLPTRLAMLTTLNLIHSQRAEREVQRLIGALQGPLPRR